MTKPIRIEHLQPCIEWWGGRKRKGRLENELAWRVSIDEVKARGYDLDFKNPHAVSDEHGDPEELLAQLDEAEDQATHLREELKAILGEALRR
jgi:type I restriction enzyme M protein